MFKHKLAYVEWVDSYGCSSQWESTKDVKALVHTCYSVGWVVKETEDTLVVVPHLSPANAAIDADEQGCGEMAIPLKSIIERVELSIPNS